MNVLLASFLLYLVSFYIVRQRKLFCLFWALCFFNLFVCLSSADAGNVTIRIGRHQEFVRIVFSATEDYFQNAAVKHTANTAVVSFSSNVNLFFGEKELIKNGGFFAEGINIEAKGNICTLNFQRLSKINVFRLSSPPRLVLDAYFEQPSKSEWSSDIPLTSFVIDPGHGGYDYGIKGKNFIEKDFVLSFVKELSNAFEKKGKKIFISRKGDYFVSIKERARFAKQKNPDMFISVHVSSKNELCVYSAQDKGDINIINSMLSAFKKEFKINAMHERLPISILKDIGINGFLIEIPNPDEFNYDKKRRETIIDIILKSLLLFNTKLDGKDTE